MQPQCFASSLGKMRVTFFFQGQKYKFPVWDVMETVSCLVCHICLVTSKSNESSVCSPSADGGRSEDHLQTDV